MQDWPLLMQRALNGGFDGGVKVGGGHDDEGIAAAEFEDGLLDEPPSLSGDGAAGGFAAGEGDGGDARVGEKRLDLCGLDEQRLENAGGKPARRTRASMARAHWGTLEACLSRPTLPAISAGAKNGRPARRGSSRA